MQSLTDDHYAPLLCPVLIIFFLLYCYSSSYYYYCLLSLSLKGTNAFGGEYVSLTALTMMELATCMEEAYPNKIHKCFFCTRMTLKVCVLT